MHSIVRFGSTPVKWSLTHTAAPSDQNQATKTWNHYRIIKCNIPIDGKDQQLRNTASLDCLKRFLFFSPSTTWTVICSLFFKMSTSPLTRTRSSVLTWEPWSSNLFVALPFYMHRQVLHPGSIFYFLFSNLYWVDPPCCTNKVSLKCHKYLIFFS